MITNAYTQVENARQDVRIATEKLAVAIQDTAKHVQTIVQPINSLWVKRVTDYAAELTEMYEHDLIERYGLQSDRAMLVEALVHTATLELAAIYQLLDYDRHWVINSEFDCDQVVIRVNDNYVNVLCENSEYDFCYALKLPTNLFKMWDSNSYTSDYWIACYDEYVAPKIAQFFSNRKSHLQETRK